MLARATQLLTQLRMGGELKALLQLNLKVNNSITLVLSLLFLLYS